jgi:hypothetical protein
MPETGFIDHIGIGVPDLVAAKEYYDELMSVLRAQAPRVVRDRPRRTAQLRTGRRSGVTVVLLQSGAGGNLLTRPDRPTSPRVPSREQSGRAGST